MLLSGDEKIDNFIQERQLEIRNSNDVVFEWIPYNNFNKIIEIDRNDFMTIYSAIWKDGPLHKKTLWSNYTRESNKVKRYSVDSKSFFVLYGISKNPYTNDYILVQNNYTLMSGNEKFDDFIHETQLKIDKYEDVVIEWIPYNHFNKIEEIGRNDFMTIYSAIWKDGPLSWNRRDNNCTRSLNKKVKKYLIYNKKFLLFYGISKNSYTNDYILVFNWSSGNEKIDEFIQEVQLKIKYHHDAKDGPLYNEDWWSIDYTRESNKEVALKCLHNSQNFIDSVINEAKKYSTKSDAFFVLHGISKNPYTNEYILVFNWASGNEKIDEFIREMRLKIKNYNDVVFEWIPYNHFKKQNFIESVINEAKRYSIVDIQNNYILMSGNEKIDEFIQERQLKIKNHNDLVFEWIPYNHFSKIEEIGRNDFMTIYSAIWKDGPLHKDNYWGNYTRESNKEVALKCLHNSWNFVQSVTNEARKYLGKNCFKIYGISQNQDTYDYILVQQHPPFLSGNNEIDYFIQERQLEIENYNDIIFRWIPYNYFSRIEKIGSSDFTTVYSATCKVDPLHKKAWRRINYAGVFKKTKIKDRISNKEVALKCLHYNSWNFVESVINEVKKYLVDSKGFFVLCGMSKNPNTGDYILVFNWTGANKEYPDTNDYIFVFNCQWISGNKKIDEFVQERQLQIKNYNDIVFEWIPYNHFSKIEKTGRNDSMTIYSAIWKDGPLHKKDWWSINYTRESNKEVALRPLHNSQNFIESVINEAKKYSIDCKRFVVLYGISQNPVTNDYILVQNNSLNFTNWASGNENIDEFIQEMQLQIKDHNDIVIEWIPYNDFDKIEKVCRNEFITLYSAIWNNGPLYWDKQNNNYMRDSNKEVVLKCLHTSQNCIDYLIYETKKYSTKNDEFLALYGVSQNPNSNDYILVQNNYILTSENEKIDDFIQKRQLEIKSYNNIIFEWIPDNQFNKIEKTVSNNFMTIYSAIWKDGPLYYNDHFGNYIRDSNKKVELKCLHNSRDSVDSVINESKKYSIDSNRFLVLYGISQDSYTNDYILVQNHSSKFTNWISGNEKIDYFIQEMQIKIKDHNDTVFEWIPYNHFGKIEKIGGNNIVTIYSAIWEDGPLYWDKHYIRGSSNKKVALKYLYNSQNSVDCLINEARKYSAKNDGFLVLYGISQNPNTNNYILVQNSSINLTNWISGNEKIDDFIQEMQLKINHNDIVFEWIPYNRFNKIEKTGGNDFITVYSAIWKDGPLHLNKQNNDYTRDSSNKEVALKCLHNSQNFVDFVINEAKKYSTNNVNENENCFKLYGISQNLDTNEFILVQSNYINSINWMSENEKIDDFIQKMQLKINPKSDVVFEWIQYCQFNEIKEIGKGGFSTVYSAIWKNGPLHWYENKRSPNKKVALKRINNSQNLINELLNEVKVYTTETIGNSSILKIYGISRDPVTKNYIIVLHYAAGGNFDNWISINENYKYFDWKKKIRALYNIASGLEEIHEKKMVHHDFHTGNILFGSPFAEYMSEIYISDMGLCGEVGNVDKTQIYGILPYVAPEVLRGKPYTQAADIYSFGMIMYFVATGRQPFDNCAHDNYLVLDICRGIRPEINEEEGPKRYIDLMKKCWHSNSKNRPNITELNDSLLSIIVDNLEIEKSENYRNLHLSKEGRQTNTHPQAIYISRLLNPFTDDLPKYDYNSECSDCIITTNLN
ncbi:hypothetical protein RclHR1_00960002 [Rhizophagus clarus]|uniref:Protein kinase domain-containing protein n=1 Tax=Rhizophagus clarus TaxID=94130 RepID=A0A2Z6SF17_9GLOM|nr:hypothetical protein RclHR1_00960002 [Rhizophagus clarus]